MMMRYPITLVPDDNGTIMATCPDLPEVTTFGDDEAEATLHACDAIVTAIMGRIADRDEVPLPSAVTGSFATLGVSDELKIGLYRTMREEGVGKAVLAKRMGYHLPQIDRLLDLSHASRLDVLENALRAVGRDITVRIVRAA